MTKLVIAPNSFRGSLSTFEVCKAINKGLGKVLTNAEIIQLPIADGGEYSKEVLLHYLGGKTLVTTVVGPLGKATDAEWCILGDKRTAVIEMSEASGIKLIPKRLLDPLVATSFGTGQLIAAALDEGCSKIVVGLGGSATVDGGAGMLQALGVRLLDENGYSIARGGGALADLRRIDVSNMDPRLRNLEIVVACDVNSTLTGPTGAAMMFGPQKGATREVARALDGNLGDFSRLVLSQLGIDVVDIPFGGASGGIAAALHAFLGARLEQGVDLVLRHVDFEAYLPGCSLVITAEGKLDNQTLMRKGPYGVAEAARKYGVPVILIVGQIEKDLPLDQFLVFDAVISICSRPMSLVSSIKQAKHLVTEASEQIGRILTLGSKLRFEGMV